MKTYAIPICMYPLEKINMQTRNERNAHIK